MTGIVKQCETCHAPLPIRTKRGSFGNTRFCQACRVITVFCEGCGKEIERDRATYQRQKQLFPDRKDYCTYLCSAKHRGRQKRIAFHKDSLPPIEYNPLILELFKEECPDCLIYKKPVRTIGWEWEKHQSYMGPLEVKQIYKREDKR